MRKQPLVMVVLDGWGIGEEDASNPISAAKPKNINYIRHKYPAGTLQASGIAVGLPWGENGDSEVGHMTLGAGKTLYQDYPRISLKIKDGTFYENESLKTTLDNAKKNNSRIHLAGLIGRSNVHSSLEHLNALIEMARSADLEPILHIFTDGRDSPPKSAADIVADLPKVQVGSISGRFYAMDRDLHWERTATTYRTLLGLDSTTPQAQNVSQVLNKIYSAGTTDEFIEPILINPEWKIRDGDSVIFFNYREDSMKQLAEMFADPETGENHQIPQNLSVVTFTKYSRKLNFPVAFPADTVLNPIGKVISDRGLVQLRIAETEKYAHVTYFFNGLVEPPFKNEYRILIPSKNIARHDASPEMMASEITTRAIAAISEGVYDFILINYANADIIGHTGNFDAAVTAVRVLDEQIGTLTRAVLDEDGTLVITSDHGNVEHMINARTGLSETTHDPSSVPIYVIRNGYEREKSDEFVMREESTNIGVLSDVTPTVLELMGIPKPDEMTGVSLLQSLR